MNLESFIDKLEKIPLLGSNGKTFWKHRGSLEKDGFHSIVEERKALKWSRISEFERFYKRWNVYHFKVLDDPP